MKVRYLPGNGRGSPSGDERGTATLLLVAVLAVLLTLGLGAMVVAVYAAATHQARSAADLAALAGASAFSRGQAPCSAAGRAAGANHSRLLSCEQVGDELDFVVTVRVAVNPHPMLPGLGSLGATAYAGRES